MKFNIDFVLSLLVTLFVIHLAIVLPTILQRLEKKPEQLKLVCDAQITKRVEDFLCECSVIPSAEQEARVYLESGGKIIYNPFAKEWCKVVE